MGLRLDILTENEITIRMSRVAELQNTKRFDVKRSFSKVAVKGVK